MVAVMMAAVVSNQTTTLRAEVRVEVREKTRPPDLPAVLG